MDFDILDIIEQATTEADAFEKHPMCEFSMEEQVLYLNGLALVMNADGHIDDSEKEYIRILIKSIGLDESSLEDMVAFAKAPDKDTVQAFFRAFRRKPIAQLFLFDALMMTRRDGKVEEKEIAVVNKIAEQLEILKGTQQDIFDLFCHIKNRNWQESALYFSSHLLNPEHFKHLLAYHEVNFDSLMEETVQLRSTRLLQAIKEKMPKVKTGGNIKPTLDHDIVIPLLQSELDRGDASVVNDILTLNNDNKKTIILKEIGLCWNKEDLSLYSEENIEVKHSVIIHQLIEILDGNLTLIDAIELLYGLDVIRMVVEGNAVKSVSEIVSIDSMRINVCLINDELWILRVLDGQNQSHLKLNDSQWVTRGDFVGYDGDVSQTRYQRCKRVECNWNELLTEGLKVQ